MDEQDTCTNSCEVPREPSSDLKIVEENVTALKYKTIGLKKDLEDILLLLTQGDTTRNEAECEKNPNEETTNRFQAISQVINKGLENIDICEVIINQIKGLVK